MRLFIIGATGRTGAELVGQGLARGHSVTAFVRSPQKITRAHERLTIITGNPLDADQLRRAMPGHDVVLSALGPNGSGPTTIVADGAKSTVRAMQETGVRRLEVVSVAFLFSGLLTTIVRNLFFRAVGRDSREMERAVVGSGMDWTIVRPPRLTGGPRTERYRVTDERLPPRGFAISYADLAHFLLDEAEQPRHLRRVVGVSR
jgi:putative NADH-flavin reductase